MIGVSATNAHPWSSAQQPAQTQPGTKGSFATALDEQLASQEQTRTTPATVASNTSDTATPSALKKTPAQALEEYLAMSHAERYQLAWLANRGLTKEEFDALPAEEQQALMEEMQREMLEEMKEKMA